MVTHLLLLANILYTLSLSNTKKNPSKISLTPFKVNVTSVAYAAVPNSEALLSASVLTGDGRIESVQRFLASYRSPLTQLAGQIVADADTYHIDYRLIPAISIQESTGCQVIPIDSYNCWGYGIYGKHVTRFDSFSDGITQVTKALASHYIGKGLTTPAAIMSLWNPISPNGAWAQGVGSYMGQM